MSIDNEILRIKNAKTAIRNAVIAKGGTLTEGQLIDDYAAAVTALPTETDVDLDFVTATASDILAGKVGADVNGLPVNGNIQTVTADLTDNVVTVPKGYIETAQTLTVPAVTASLSDNTVTVPKGYIASEQTLTVAEAKAPTVSGNAVTVYKGYQAAQDTVEIAKVTATRSANVVTIPEGYHDANTVTVPEAGAVTVSGNVVTIPSGYNANQQTKTVGTAKGAVTYTPSTADQTIAAGTYLSGVQTIKGDANLIADNIAEGVEIFGVAGTHQGGSSMDFYRCAAVYGPRDVDVFVISGCPVEAANGTYMPTEYTTEDWEGAKYPVYSNGTYYYYYEPSNWMNWGISQDYTSSSLLYSGSGTSWSDTDWNPVEGMSSVESKVTVDLDVPKTWDGYKAVAGSDGYTLETVLTTGLTYGTAYKPIIGKIYSADASAAPALKFAIPAGAKVYASFAKNSATAETGQAITYTNTYKHDTVFGIPCICFASSAYAQITAAVDLTGDFSISSWYKRNVNEQGCTCHIGGNDASGFSLLPGITEVALKTTGDWTDRLLYQGRGYFWCHIVLVKRSDKVQVYYDGKLLCTFERSVSLTDNGLIYINAHVSNSGSISYNKQICHSAFRFYERALTDDEIFALANEFAPDNKTILT